MRIPLRIAAVALIPVLFAGLGAHGALAAGGSWAKLPAAPITTGVAQPVSVWTGREMIIHGSQHPAPRTSKAQVNSPTRESPGELRPSDERRDRARRAWYVILPGQLASRAAT